MQLAGRTIEFSRRGIIIAAVIITALLIIVLSFVLSDDTNGPETNTGFFGGLFDGNELPTVGDLPTGTNTQSSEKYTESVTSRIHIISQEPVVGAALVPGKPQIKYFNRSTGHLFQNGFEGKEEVRVSNVTIAAVMNAIWSPDKTYAALSHYNNGDMKYYYAHYTSTSTAESGFLSRNIASLAMSPAESRIAYFLPANGQYSLITASPTNTKQKTVFTTPFPDFDIAWQDKNTISLSTRGSAYAQSYLYSLNAGGGSLQKILGGIEGLTLLWDPKGKNLLYSQTSNEGRTLSLHVLTMANGISKNTGIETLPEKCAWSRKSEQVIFCGVPQQIPRAHLPDDWWQGSVSFIDALWRIDLSTGEQREIMPAFQLDATHLFTSDDEEYLLFTNKKDGLLWSLKIN